MYWVMTCSVVTWRTALKKMEAHVRICVGPQNHSIMHLFKDILQEGNVKRLAKGLLDDMDSIKQWIFTRHGSGHFHPSLSLTVAQCR